MANKHYLTLIALLLLPASVVAREQIRVVGSSTVFPFVAAAAEQFGRAGNFRTPIVEATGTGGGIKMFCEGVGDRYPDMVNASRSMKDGEREQCAKNGITKIIELKIGYDGIVMANARAAQPLSLSRDTLFRALARQVPVKGKLAENPYRRWRDLDPALPDAPILVYGPPPSSGTRDAFVELVMEEGCKEVPEMKQLVPDDKKRKKVCAVMREDGVFVEAGEDDNLIVQKLINNPSAVGVFGYSFLESNAALVKANPVNGVLPSYESIENGSYRVARSLFVYVKGEHFGKTSGIAEFARELVSNAAIGEDGYLVMKGLLPLNPNDREAVRAVVDFQ
jgi:phosphate transport system substrate-binding protein